MLDFDRDHAIGSDVHPVDAFPEAERATFNGIVRADGRVATRNYIGVLTTVACSAPVIRYIADAFRGEILNPYPNVDGIVALPHGTGCGMAEKSENLEKLQRCLAGLARHPNFGGVLMVGLGCEINQMDLLLEGMGLETGTTFKAFNIQNADGTDGAVALGVNIIQEMLPVVNEVDRQPVPASHLILGLECGGSDAYSGITANPALGAAADILVRHGGTAILSETTEIYGAEHLLTRRAMTRETGEKLIGLIRWWEDYTARLGATINNNPTPGNKAGGLTTILEKSLGAAAKGGTTNLMAVYDYAESVTSKGLVFMDTPGYDPVSVTGMVAGGANVICFTTGRGTIYGFKPTPVIKLASNSQLYESMPTDIDINCGAIVDGELSVAEMGKSIFRRILETASGKPTKSEHHGIGDSEFIPWQIGPVL
jgi:altronate hydrolase